MSETLNLFGSDKEGKGAPVRASAPLAQQLRPVTWEEFQGLDAVDQNLVRQLRSGAGKPPSLILWGPPGSGKTTLARLIGHSYASNFVEFSAVLGGVKEVREIVAQAKQSKKSTILFVDEIHRFNKGQQDAFLPHVEDGTIILIGATTENPSFYLNNALLSRVKVVVLPALGDAALMQIVEKAETKLGIQLTIPARKIVTGLAGGDARRLLNFMESLTQALPGATEAPLDAPAVENFLKDSWSKYYDREGEAHYDMVSAFIKSMRGSDPDAALFWGFRMIESGEDPRFIVRRMMIFASEDIGNADPRALQVAVATSEAYEKLGVPEGKIPIAQCITYLATAPKSNRSYLAMHAAIAAVNENTHVSVPLHLRNAPTKLMKELHYGAEYQYPHDYEHGHVPNVQYLPDKLQGQSFYKPTQRGYEKNISERMSFLKERARNEAGGSDAKPQQNKSGEE